MYGNLFQPGEMIEGNEVLGLLDRGGFSEIYKVRAPEGETLVLKVLDPRRMLSERDKERLLQEGRVLSMIEHINVVRFYGSGIHKGRHVWILLEHVPGKNLREVIHHHGGKPPIELSVRWIRQICEGVAEAHKIPAIHRDLKPENVVICPGDLAKVIDFGLAKLEVIGLRTATLEERCGTALYMSPEQFDHKRAHPTMDVYSIGMMAYELLAGRHPMKNHPSEGETTMGEICARQSAHRPPPLVEIDGTIPADVSTIVEDAIEKDPEQRIQTVRLMADRLHHALKALILAQRAAARKKLAAVPEAPVPAVVTARDTPLLEVPAAARPDEIPPSSGGGFRPGQVMTMPLAPAVQAARTGVEMVVTAPLPRAPMRSVSLPFVAAPQDEHEEEDEPAPSSRRGWVEIPSIRVEESGIVWNGALTGADVMIAAPPAGENDEASNPEPSETLHPFVGEARRSSARDAIGSSSGAGGSSVMLRRKVPRAAVVAAGMVMGGGLAYLTIENFLAAAPRPAVSAAPLRPAGAPVVARVGEDGGPAMPAASSR